MKSSAVPMILIMGCTASGKSKLAFEMAKRLNGEILSIDSMKVYRSMDIGTAKPGKLARSEVRHHLVDVVDASEKFSLGTYFDLATEAISSISSNNRPIIAAGGTGMYIKALIEGIFDGPPADPAVRDEIQSDITNNGSHVVHAELVKVDPVSGEKIHPNDAKRIIRAMEVYRLTGKPISEYQTQFGSGEKIYPWILIELARDKEDGNHRINMRVKKMVQDGLVDEVKSLLDSSISDQAAQAVGYAEIISYLRGDIKLDEAIEKIKINTRRLAKSQRTWFRSFLQAKRVECRPDDTVEFVADKLESYLETALD